MSDFKTLLGQIVPATYLLSERAATLREGAVAACNGSGTTESRLSDWLSQAAAGNPDVLARRLGILGFQVDSVRALLTDDHDCVQEAELGWIGILRRALEAGVELAHSGSREEGDSAVTVDSRDELPFKDLWLPFVNVARGLITEGSQQRYRQFSPECRHALERQLLHRLCNIGSSAAYASFSVYRDASQATAPGSRALYREFVSDHLTTGSLFAEYSALARLMSTQVDFWVEDTRLFMERLEADFPEILASLGGCRSFPGYGLDAKESVFAQLGILSPGLSDPHERGRTVISLVFRNGARLIYKPKSIDIEAAWGKFVEWINDQGPLRDLRSPKCLPRESYGWVEFVEHLPCHTEAEARDFFVRSGMLCALFYILRGFDYQEDNLVACGAYPVAIDHEMLLYPPEPEQLYRNGRSGIPVGYGSSLLYRHSVIKTKLLPVWQTRANGQLSNVGALESACRSRPVRYETRWLNVNTDAMAPGQIPLEEHLEWKSNVPFMQGIPLLLSAYLPEFIHGFRAMYASIERNKHHLRDPEGPLSTFRDCETRYLFRPTGAYTSMLNLALHYLRMKDVIDFDIFLEKLWRSVAVTGRWELAYIVEFEQQCMQRLDVPRLVTTPASHGLTMPQAPAAGRLFHASGYELVCASINNLGREDMMAQVRLINLMVSCYREGSTPQPEEMEAAFAGRRRQGRAR